MNKIKKLNILYEKYWNNLFDSLNFHPEKLKKHKWIIFHNLEYHDIYTINDEDISKIKLYTNSTTYENSNFYEYNIDNEFKASLITFVNQYIKNDLKDVCFNIHKLTFSDSSPYNNLLKLLKTLYQDKFIKIDNGFIVNDFKFINNNESYLSDDYSRKSYLDYNTQMSNELFALQMFEYLKTYYNAKEELQKNTKKINELIENRINFYITKDDLNKFHSLLDEFNITINDKMSFWLEDELYLRAEYITFISGGPISYPYNKDDFKYSILKRFLYENLNLNDIQKLFSEKALERTKESLKKEIKEHNITNRK